MRVLGIYLPVHGARLESRENKIGSEVDLLGSVTCLVAKLWNLRRFCKFLTLLLQLQKRQITGVSSSSTVHSECLQ